MQEMAPKKDQNNSKRRSALLKANSAPLDQSYAEKMPNRALPPNAGIQPQGGTGKKNSTLSDILDGVNVVSSKKKVAPIVPKVIDPGPPTPLIAML